MKRTKKMNYLKYFAVIFSTALLLVTAGCQGKSKATSFEGANVSVSYDKSNWKLLYQETQPYQSLVMVGDLACITIMPAQADRAVLEEMHTNVLNFYKVTGQVTEEKEFDKWEEENIFYYTDFIDNTDWKDYLVITWGKQQGDMLLVAVAEISVEDGMNEKVNEELEESLAVLSGVQFSEKTGAENVKATDGMLIHHEMLQGAIGAGNEDGAEEYLAVSEEVLNELNYVEKVEFEDTMGFEKSYKVYAPVGSEAGDNFLMYNDDAIDYSAFAFYMLTEDNLYEAFESKTESYRKLLQGENESGEDDAVVTFSDVVIGDVVEVGKNRYQIMEAASALNEGDAYKKTYIFYLDVQSYDSAVLVEITISDDWADKTTAAILDELSKCYGFELP